VARYTGAIIHGTKVHPRFNRWAESGVWERVFQYLAADPDNEYAMINSTLERTANAAPAAKEMPARTRRSGARAVD
jgi:hypothetical protein